MKKKAKDKNLQEKVAEITEICQRLLEKARAVGVSSTSISHKVES